MWWVLPSVICLALAAAAAAAWGVPRWRRRRRLRRFQQARDTFRLRREGLEARFFQLASESGKPRDLRWVDCVFDNEVAFARDRQSGELSAFVGVTISFEAIEGGLMEDVEAVGNLRAATAVFRHVDGQWITEGRVMYNLNPTEAIAFYRRQLELVAGEPPRVAQ